MDMQQPPQATGPAPAAARVVAINAGVSDPSSTRLLTERLLSKIADDLGRADVEVDMKIIDLAPLAGDIANALTAGFPSTALREVIGELADADAVVAATPVYKAGISGLFKAFVDVLDNDLLVAKPVLLAGTAGTARHAMVVDDQMRPLFAFMRTLTTPGEHGVRPPRAQWHRTCDRRRGLDGLPTRIRRQRNAIGEGDRRRRLQLGPDAAGNRRLVQHATGDLLSAGCVVVTWWGRPSRGLTAGVGAPAFS